MEKKADWSIIVLMVLLSLLSILGALELINKIRVGLPLRPWVASAVVEAGVDSAWQKEEKVNYKLK